MLKKGAVNYASARVRITYVLFLLILFEIRHRVAGGPSPHIHDAQIRD